MSKTDKQEEILEALLNKRIVERLEAEVFLRASETQKLTGNNPQQKIIEKQHQLKGVATMLEGEIRALRAMIDEKYRV